METKLLMHRHWSLLEAMIHTPEVMARLSTFSEGSQGQAVLYRILATTGIPVQQVWIHHVQWHLSGPSVHDVSASPGCAVPKPTE